MGNVFRSWQKPLMVVCLLALIALPFQNCAPPAMTESPMDMASLSENLNPDDEIVDDDPEDDEDPPGPITDPPPGTGCSGPSAGENVNRAKTVYDLARIRDNFELKAASFSCPAIPSVPKKFDPPKATLKDGSKNPELKTYMKPFVDYVDQLNVLGDEYILQNGSTAVARCMLDWMHAWAKAGLLSEYDSKTDGTKNYTTVQGDIERIPLVSAILFNVAKIRGASGLNATKLADVDEWMKATVKPIRSFSDARVALKDGKIGAPANQNGNHYYAVMAVFLNSLLYGNSGAKDWAVKHYRLGLASIRSNGTIKSEADRGSKAFLYHQFTLRPLVLMAELAEIHGMSLYDENGKALFRLIDLIANAFKNFNTFKDKVPGSQAQTPEMMISDMAPYLDWMEIVHSRFDRPELASAIKSARKQGISERRTGGSMSLAWGLAGCRL